MKGRKTATGGRVYRCVDALIHLIPEDRTVQCCSFCHTHDNDQDRMDHLEREIGGKRDVAYVCCNVSDFLRREGWISTG